MALSVGEILGILTLRDDASKVASKARDEFGRFTGDSSKGAGLLSGALGSITSTMGGMLGAQAVWGVMSSGLSAARTAIIGTNAQLETSTLQFETLMGSSQRATEHVKGLFQFAQQTPFETGPIINASKHMQVFGGDALNTKANLTLLGDAAAVSGQGIDEVAFWTGRAYSAIQGGKPFGEAAARLQEMAILTPQARDEMERMQKAGADADAIFGVFTKNLGNFTGAMSKQANTWAGVTSSLSDTINLTLASAFRPLFDAMRDGLKATNELFGSPAVQSAIKNFSTLFATGVSSAIAAVVSIVKTMVPLVKSGIGVFQEWKEILTPFLTVLAADVWSRISGGIGSVVSVFGTLSSAVSTVWDIVQDLLPGIGASLWVEWSAKLRAISSGAVLVMDILSGVVDTVWDVIEPMASPVFGALADVFGLISGATRLLFNGLDLVFQGLSYVSNKLGIGNFLLGAFHVALTTIAKPIEWFATALGWVASKLGAAVGWLNSFIEGILDVGGSTAAELPKMEGAFDSLVTGGIKPIPIAADTAEVSLSALATKPKPKIKELSDEMKKLVGTLSGSDVIKKANEYRDAIANIGGVSKMTQEVQQDVNKAMLAAIDVYQAMGKEVPAAIQKVAAETFKLSLLPDILKKAQAEASAMTIDILEKQHAASSRLMDIRVADVGKALGAAKGFSDQMVAITMKETDLKIFQASRWRDDSLKAIEPLKRDMPAIYAMAAQDIEAIYAKMLNDAKKAATDQVGVFGEIMGNLPNVIASAIQGGGNVLQSVGSSIGASLLGSPNSGLNGALNAGISKIGTLIGGNLGPALTQTLSMALPAIGAAIGAMLPQIVGGIKKLFTGGSEAEKTAKDVGRDYGVTISKELAETIAKEGIGRMDGTLKHLADVIKEGGGVTIERLDFWTGKTRDLFSALERGSIKTGDVMKELDAIFPQLAAHIDSTTGIASAKMLELIELNDRFGTKSAEMASFVNKNLEAAVGGIGTFLQGATISSQESASAMAALASASFAKMLSGGASIQDALRALAPVVETIKTQLAAAGFTGGAAFDAMTAKIALMSDAVAGPAIQSMLGLGESIVGAHNAGILTGDMFTGLSGQVADTFNSLIAKGHSATDVLGFMKKPLQQIYELHVDTGFAIDDDTKKLLDQAQAAGIVGDQHRDAQTRSAIAMEKTAAILERMARMMGVEMPDTISNMVRTSVDKFGVMGDALKGVFLGLPDSIDIPINFTPGTAVEYPNGGGASGGGHAGASVGFPTGTYGFRDFGTGTDVRLHGVEAVVRPGDAVPGGVADASMMRELRGLRNDLVSLIPQMMSIYAGGSRAVR